MIKDQKIAFKGLDRKTPPRIKDAVEFDLKLKPYEKFELDNGIEVYAVSGGPEEVLQMEWVFYAGNWYEDQNGIAGATNHLIKNGTRSKTAFEISEHFDFYGSYLNRSCYNETAVLTLHTLTRHLPELLPVVSELITDSIFPEHELDIFKQNMKQRLEVNLKKCDFVANRLIDEYLYGIDHPYGKYAVRETYEAITKEKLIEFHRQFYLHGKLVIFVAGVLPADLYQQLNANFGKLPVLQLALPEFSHSLHPSADKQFRITNDPNGVQGAIRMARPFITRHHPDFAPMQVLNAVFGGFFGSRLMSNIREDKGYTYGIHSYFQNHMAESALMISTEAGKDVCEKAVQEVYHEMKVLREEPVSDEELLLVKNYLIGTILGDLDGPFHIIGRWKNVILNNLPEDYFVTSVDAVKRVTPAELQALANKYLQPD
ncbi:MAG TPA: pitrilysin family protein, partial [Chitinophagaceae bacterium]|nr:pitrilysin family protein [Chitinophagaceae bacterium]